MTANIVKTRGGYSLDEIATGETWIDGKPIFRKAFQVTLPNNASVVVGTVSDMDCCIRMYGFVSRLNEVRPLPFAAGGENDIRIDMSNTKGRIQVRTFTDWGNEYTGYIIAEYTKA